MLAIKAFMKEFVFINGKIVTSEEVFDGFVVVKNGKISQVGNGLYEGKLETVDVKGKYILPGLIDAHVHFRTPGMTQKEDWMTGSKAALAGGVTTVLDMPNTNPPTTDRETLELKRGLVRKEALVNYGFFLGATKTNFEEIKDIEGVAGVKVYMGSSTGNLLVDDFKTLEALMKDSGASKNGKILALHAENETCIREGLRAHEGEQDPAVHSKIRAPECAAQAVAAALDLVVKFRAPVHFCHVSTRAELDLIRKFKKEQPGKVAKLVSVEVTPHHLFLSDRDYETYGNLVKVNPPLRSQDDVEAMWEGIADYTADMVATDHAPHLLEEKQLPYAQAPSGVPGVQTMLPLLLNAVNQGKFGKNHEIALRRVVELCAQNPARRFGIQNKGEIIEGFDADLTVVDLNLKERVCHKFLWTKPDWSPFHGWHLTGWPVMTFVNGELMYEWRETFGRMPGREVEFS